MLFTSPYLTYRQADSTGWNVIKYGTELGCECYFMFNSDPVFFFAVNDINYISYSVP